MNQFPQSALNAHLELLAERVFQVETKWPQFKLLLRNIHDLATTLAPDKVVVSLERTLLYGGYSLIAPFFQNQKFISVDCSPESADNRGAYNESLVDDPRFLKTFHTVRASIEDTGLESGIADIVLVPNLVHHVRNQSNLFNEMSRLLRPGGKLYIFEAILRELHQIPDDFLRYTPYGLKAVLIDAGFDVAEDFEVEGGPFSAIAYCWVQALQYFPLDKRKEMEDWFYKRHFSELMDWDSQYQSNLVRSHTAFPVAYSMFASKPT